MSLWLNAGVPATEVACRAGHGVAVLLKVYAHCIDSQADAANKHITSALGDARGAEGDEDTGEEPSLTARRNPVGFQNSATGPDLGFYAARSYSLTRPPRTGRRLIRS